MLQENCSLVTFTHGSGLTEQYAVRPRDLDRFGVPSLRISITQDVTDYTHGLELISQRVTDSLFFRWDGRATARRIEDNSRNLRTSEVWDAHGLQRSGVPLRSNSGFVGEQGQGAREGGLE